jgi:hypothetical protein
VHVSAALGLCSDRGSDRHRFKASGPRWSWRPCTLICVTKDPYLGGEEARNYSVADVSPRGGVDLPFDAPGVVALSLA